MSAPDTQKSSNSLLVAVDHILKVAVNHSTQADYLAVHREAFGELRNVYMTALGAAHEPQPAASKEKTYLEVFKRDDAEKPWGLRVADERGPVIELLYSAAPIEVRQYGDAHEPCPATWQPVVDGPVVPCTLLAGHEGKHRAPEPYSSQPQAAAPSALTAALREIAVRALAVGPKDHNITLNEIRAISDAAERLAQPPPAVHSELELAAAHYVRVSQNPNLSRYITENGRHPGSGGPWAELVSAVDAAIAAQTKEV